MGSAAGRWVVLTMVLGSGMALLDSTSLNVALPALGAELGADVAGLQWVLNGYLLSLSALILLGGALGDRYGRRRVFSIGVVWFAVASALCGLAPSIEVLVAARVLQGIGGALLTPGSLAILQAAFVPGDRGRAIGAWSGLGGIAAAVGPLVGGALVELVSWRAIFLTNLPIAAVVLVVAARHVPESRDPGATGRPDALGAVLAALGLAGLTVALIRAGAQGASPQVLGLGLGGLAVLGAFVAVERRVLHPMLPPGIFASRQFTAANLVTFAVYGALGSVFFLLVVQLQVSLGYSPVQAGLATLPITALMLGLSSRAGALAQRVGPRRLMAGGPLVMAAGMGLLVRVVPGAGYATTVLPAVVLFGVGLACTVAPLTATVLAAAPAEHTGVASGVNNAVARAASLLAVAAIPPLVGLSGVAPGDAQAFTAGFTTAMVVAAGLAVMGGAVAWLLVGDDVLVTDGDTSHHCAVQGPPLRGPRAAD
jgi:EmrB/QacA subfamily drug resistance transporter